MASKTLERPSRCRKAAHLSGFTILEECILCFANLLCQQWGQCDTNDLSQPRLVDVQKRNFICRFSLLRLDSGAWTGRTCREARPAEAHNIIDSKSSPRNGLLLSTDSTQRCLHVQFTGHRHRHRCLTSPQWHHDSVTQARISYCIS